MTYTMQWDIMEANNSDAKNEESEALTYAFILFIRRHQEGLLLLKSKGNWDFLIFYKAITCLQSILHRRCINEQQTKYGKYYNLMYT